MSTKNTYKYFVIGNNSTGLSIANFLAKDHKVALLYDRQSDYKSTHEYSGEFEYTPAKKDWNQHIVWFNTNFNFSIESSSQENNSKTVDSGKLCDFLGFGDKDFKTIDDLTWYNESDRLSLNKNKYEIQQHLLESFTGDLINNADVTEIHVVDKKVDHLVINGQKKYFADKFIFCNPPSGLLQLIDHSLLPAKFKQKVKKQKALSTLQVLYRHNEELAFKDELHFLMGNKTDYEPCLGYFWKNKEDKIFSQWITLMPSDQCEDIEYVGSHFKNLKKQIKRAYPDFYDHIEFEKVFVINETHGFFDFDFKNFGELKGVENLILASPLLSKEHGLYATFDMSQKTIEHLNSLETQA